ncbi:MAG: HlyD family secretion protein [Isosphaeraceae bacterium]
MAGKLISRILWVLFVGAALFLGWKVYEKKKSSALPAGIASSNGRIEAIQVDVSAKEPGRIAKILAREGDLVQPEQVVARMDITTLEAQLARAKASEATTQEKATVVKSSIVRRESELRLAESEYAREKNLYSRRMVSREDYDQKEATLKTAQAALDEEKAKLNTVLQSVEVDKAEVKHTQTRIDDSVLKSPVKGRVLYRLAEEGEVLGSGGKVLTLINLEDVYMDLFLPGQEVARIKYGDEARIVLDAAPGRVAPAKVTFVSPEAQFTPKQVETRSERDKLMFRVKIQVPPELVMPYIDRIKTGIRGVGYVRYDNAVAWPDSLKSNLEIPKTEPVASESTSKVP